MQPATPEQRSAVRAVSEAQNRAALRLATALNLGNSGKNELVSPLSLNVALAMLLNGADGVQADAAASAMGLPSPDISMVNVGYRRIMDQVRSDPQGSMRMANGVWLLQPVGLNDTYVNSMQSMFDATVRTFPAPDSAALNDINGFVNQNTKGRIPKLIDRLTPQDLLFIVNALAFDGKWQFPFEKGATRKAAFAAPGGSVQADMMRLAGKDLFYTNADGNQWLSLPYAGGRYAMVLALPKPGSAVQDVLTQLESVSRADIVPPMRKSEGSVQIPKFRFEKSYDLIPALRQMGASALFDKPSTYPRMFAGLKQEAVVSTVVQKTMIKVDEVGTEAAAATGIGVSLTAMPMEREPFQFIADRPFLMMIREMASGNLVFLGVVNDPTVG